MRGISFRGKRIEYGEWVHGYLIGDDVIVGNIVEFNDEYFNTSFWYKVRPETLGQYTGLQDKKGKEIYDSDIYRWKGYEVRDGKQIRPERIGVVKFDIYELFKLRNIIEGNGTLEVIGNIYESPHLLDKA